MTTDQLSALLAQDPAAVLEHDRRLYEQQIVRAADLIAAHAQVTVQKMQQKLVGEIKVTPAEVRRYFKDLPQDSIPSGGVWGLFGGVEKEKMPVICRFL